MKERKRKNPCVRRTQWSDKARAQGRAIQHARGLQVIRAILKMKTCIMALGYPSLSPEFGKYKWQYKPALGSSYRAKASVGVLQLWLGSVCWACSEGTWRPCGYWHRIPVNFVLNFEVLFKQSVVTLWHRSVLITLCHISLYADLICLWPWFQIAECTYTFHYSHPFVLKQGLMAVFSASEQSQLPTPFFLFLFVCFFFSIKRSANKSFNWVISWQDRCPGQDKRPDKQVRFQHPFNEPANAVLHVYSTGAASQTQERLQDYFCIPLLLLRK